ncbi:hypothetical protein SAMN05661044_05345 [Olivibacter domesticus]|uniref:Uncharacterized protein n=1 Tax=Olivibacter domesticus TaxID=407022 RepID=A0A1H7YVT2_OLID1|nr:hypothetical protein SAMN05661044_05345 [Olivibacter domesticus]
MVWALYLTFHPFQKLKIKTNNGFSLQIGILQIPLILHIMPALSKKSCNADINSLALKLFVNDILIAVNISSRNFHHNIRLIYNNTSLYLLKITYFVVISRLT